jgi:hypothetical protein
MQLRSIVFRALRANLHWVVASVLIGAAIIVLTHANTIQAPIVAIHARPPGLP